MKISRIFINCFLCLSLLASSSCITKYLWGDKSYEEPIYQVFVGEDGRYVVFVSQDYHYNFTDNSGLLKEILSLRQNDILTINQEKTHLKLDNKNDINGVLVLEGPFDVLPQEDMVKLHTLGFSPDKSDNVTIKINLTGRRYAARYLGQNFATTSNRGIRKIQIYYRGDSSFVKDVGKAAVTPIAVTIDAVLLIGKVVIYKPFNFLGR